MVAVSLASGCHAETPSFQFATTATVQQDLAIDLRPLDLERFAPAAHLEAFQSLHNHPLLRNGDGLTLEKAIRTLEERHETASNSQNMWLGINLTLGALLFFILCGGAWLLCPQYSSRAKCCPQWARPASPAGIRGPNWQHRLDNATLPDQELNPEWPTFQRPILRPSQASPTTTVQFSNAQSSPRATASLSRPSPAIRPRPPSEDL
jgi:hypothetical protein